MRKLPEMLVDFLLNDSASKTSNDLADALVNEEGFSVARAAQESNRFLETCKAEDKETLHEILESGTPTLRRHAAIELARLFDITCIPLLLHNLEEARTEKNSKSFKAFRDVIYYLTSQMSSHPQPEHLPYCLDCLRWQKRYRLPIEPLVNTITIIAENWPSQELQEAMPYLKNHPRARQAIEATLLPGARFPIPAERPTTTENLPRPAAESNTTDSAEFLPLPSEANASTESDSFVKRLKKRMLPWR